MSLKIANRTIQKVLVVDDDSSLRQSYGYSIEDLGLEPIYEAGPLHTVEESLIALRGKADALLCDYHLRIKNFSQLNGDQLVASSNRAGLPAILCTTYTDSDITVMRSKRRYIPSLLKPATLNPDTISVGFERCIRESEGIFDPSRKPWRSLVRVAEIEERRQYFYAVVPGWNADEKIRIYMHDIPDELQAQIQPNTRLHAQVNVGADSPEQLYFSEWT